MDSWDHIINLEIFHKTSHLLIDVINPRFTLVMFWDVKEKMLQADLFLAVFRHHKKTENALDEWTRNIHTRIRIIFVVIIWFWWSVSLCISCHSVSSPFLRFSPVIGQTQNHVGETDRLCMNLVKQTEFGKLTVPWTIHPWISLGPIQLVHLQHEEF